jgi:hypothetical protein
MFSKEFSKMFTSKKKTIKRMFSQMIISQFGGENIMAFFPVLEWKINFCGSTGYIDQISHNDVNYPIMIGIDDANRSFITVCHKYNHSKYSRHSVTTIFQRYTNDKYTWTHGTNSFSFVSESGYIISRNILQHDSFKEKIKNLITKNILDNEICLSNSYSFHSNS